jgi:hypothetical protein
MRANLMPSFTYVVGNNLDRYFIPPHDLDSGATLDVHGNQVGLLNASKCYRLSDMDCSSCHNVHVKETRKMEVFSARCMTCHKEGTDAFCKQVPVAGLVLTKNCIDCHMPSLPSGKVFLQSSASVKPTPFLVRTHLIDTYPEQIEQFLEKLKDPNSSNK